MTCDETQEVRRGEERGGEERGVAEVREIYKGE